MRLSFENLEILNAKNAVVCAVRVTRTSRSAAGAMQEEGDEETSEETAEGSTSEK